MKHEFNNLINKYAIIISLATLGEILLSHFGLLPGFLWIGYYFIMNIVIAIIVSFDLTKFKIKSPLTSWSTILFNLLGVVLLLIQILRKEKTANA